MGGRSTRSADRGPTGSGPALAGAAPAADWGTTALRRVDPAASERPIGAAPVGPSLAPSSRAPIPRLPPDVSTAARHRRRGRVRPWGAQALPPVTPGPAELARRVLLDRCRVELSGRADELGLAALIESWGITDATARERYGCDDVFSLARTVWAELDDDSGGGGLEARPVPLMTITWVLRGAAYLPPAVFVAIALSDAGAPASGLAFAIATCLGWGMTEAVSRIAHASINRGGVGAIRHLVERVLLVGAPAIVVGSGVVALASGSVGAGLLIGTQLLYLLAAMVMLPLGRERDLVTCLAPAIVVAVAIAVGHGPSAVLVVLPFALAGETAALGLTIWHLRGVTHSGFGAPTVDDLIEALPFLLAGAAMGAFVLACTAVVFENLASRRATMILFVPLMLSLGYSEIGIRRFRCAVDRELARSNRVTQFARRSRRAVVLYAGSYVAVLAGLELAGRSLEPERTAAIPTGAYVVVGMLGLSLFLTLVLMVMDHVVPVLAGYAGAAAVLLAAILTDELPHAVIVTAIVVTAVLLAVLLGAALLAVSHPARHAFD